jgi:Fe-S cluster biogenesis protein NfuA
MFIQTEATPNPATLKFVPGQAVMGELSPADFPNAESASASPLATALFAIENVAGVFLGSDFISITKSEGEEWQHLKPALLAAIMDHFVAGRPVMNAGATTAAAASDSSQDPTVSAIIELIDTRIRPAVAQDGGDIVFHDFQDGIVSLQMRGACAGCPSSTATLKQGIENLLKHYIPEVQEVRAVI